MVQKKLGQLSIESVVIIGALLLCSLMILYVFSSRSSEVYVTRDRVYAQQLSDKISTIADSVFLLGENGSLSMYFPSSINGKNYSLYFLEHFVVIVTDTIVVSSPTSSYLNTSVHMPVTHTLPGTYSLRYVGGEVHVQ